MHTARTLQAGSYDVEIDGRQSDLTGVFPDWDSHDRFGLVLNEPFGSLGANLMINAAITSYYDVRRDTHGSIPTYPEVYLFHIGGPHGDHSMYDVSPGRKEVHLGTSPWELIVAIAERGITRLAVPDAVADDFDYLNIPGGWFYATSLLDRLTTVYAYSADGTVRDPTLTLHTDDPLLLDARTAVLTPEAQQAMFEHVTEQDVRALGLGNTSMEDIDDYSATLKLVTDQVPLATRQVLLAKYENATSDQYRLIDGDEALKLLKQSCDAISGDSGASPEFPFRVDVRRPA